jgi:hypothetical protein
MVHTAFALDGLGVLTACTGFKNLCVGCFCSALCLLCALLYTVQHMTGCCCCQNALRHAATAL